jgi:O-antigen ligase
MRLSNIPLRSEQAARYCAIALGFSIPISVAFDNVLLALILVMWLATIDYRTKIECIWRNPVALAALALFALLVAGLAYGTRDPGDGLRYLGKYADLAFVPIFVTLFRTGHARLRAWDALAAAMLLTLVLSFLLWTGMISHNVLIGDDPYDPSSVFKRYLTQSVLMAYAAFLFLQLGLAAPSRGQCYFWLLFAALAAFNVAFIGLGRSGQVVLAVLLAYVMISQWRWKGVLLIAAAAAVLIAAGGVHGRLGQVIVEWQLWQPGVATETSTGQRLEFYRNSLDIALAHPLIGNGTGSFPRVYADHVAGRALPATDNPHNEYLNIAVQTGIIGLLLLLYLFYSIWRCASQLPTMHERHLARGLVITIAVGCLFNSLLMDHVEGLLLAWAAGVLFAGLPPRLSRASQT